MLVGGEGMCARYVKINIANNLSALPVACFEIVDFVVLLLMLRAIEGKTKRSVSLDKWKTKPSSTRRTVQQQMGSRSGRAILTFELYHCHVNTLLCCVSHWILLLCFDFVNPLLRGYLVLEK